MRLSPCLVPALGALLLATGAQAQSNPAGQANSATHAATQTATESQHNGGTLSSTDKKFLSDVAQGAKYELALAKLAEQKATKPDIKHYAQTVINDHEQLNSSLHQLAQKKDVQLPTQMTQQQQTEVNRLKGLSGTAFDQAYQTETRRINSQDKAELQKEINSTQNSDVKTFAQQMQQADAKHQQMAQTL